jgi:hypothetical protein
MILLNTAARLRSLNSVYSKGLLLPLLLLLLLSSMFPYHWQYACDMQTLTVKSKATTPTPPAGAAAGATLPPLHRACPQTGN